MPVRASALAALAGGAEMRMYSQQRFGRLANLVLLDNRQYRDPQVCTRGGKAGSGTWIRRIARRGTIPGGPCSAPRRSDGSTSAFAHRRRAGR